MTVLWNISSDALSATTSTFHVAALADYSLRASGPSTGGVCLRSFWKLDGIAAPDSLIHDQRFLRRFVHLCKLQWLQPFINELDALGLVVHHRRVQIGDETLTPVMQLRFFGNHRCLSVTLASLFHSLTPTVCWLGTTHPIHATTPPGDPDMFCE